MRLHYLLVVMHIGIVVRLVAVLHIQHSLLYLFVGNRHGLVVLLVVVLVMVSAPRVLITHIVNNARTKIWVLVSTNTPLS